MLSALKDLLGALAPQAPAAPAPHTDHQLQLATAVLLVEVMRAEPDIDAAERHTVTDVLCTRFALTPDEGQHLLELAHATSRAAGDLFAFTKVLDDALSMEEKVHMVEQLWRVAYADGALGAHENHLMRRVADLLHVPHGAYVHAKMRARSDTAGAPDKPTR